MKYILLITTFILTLTIEAQPSGFIGKTNFVSINAFGGLRNSLLFNGMSDDFYSNDVNPSDNTIKEKASSKFFNHGFQFEYYRVLKQRLGVGLQYTLDYMPIARDNANYMKVSHNILFPDDMFSDYNYNDHYLMTSPRFRSYTIKPTITYVSSGSFLPIGIRHTFAFGKRFIHLRKSNNYYSINYYDENGFITEGEAIEFENIPDDFSNKYSGWELAYSASVVHPINEFLLFEFGIDFRLPFIEENISQFKKNRELIETLDSKEKKLINHYLNYNYHQHLRSEAFGNFFNVKMGLSFAF